MAAFRKLSMFKHACQTQRSHNNKQNNENKNIFFEICSAFGTVGLSSGFTSVASFGSRIVLMILMIIGRIGPISLILALGNINNTKMFKYAEERVTIG